MFDENRVKIYIGLSFTLGILLTLGFKDVYPDLERRYRRRRRGYSTWSDPLGRFRASSEKLVLQDNEANPSMAGKPTLEIPEGIESTIGNTPLFRIKSLSDATGCEILAKAEVNSASLSLSPSKNHHLIFISSSSTAQANPQKTASLST